MYSEDANYPGHGGMFVWDKQSIDAATYGLTAPLVTDALY